MTAPYYGNYVEIATGKFHDMSKLAKTLNGEAATEQHRMRIRYLEHKIDGIQGTVDLHIEVVQELTKARAKNLNQIVASLQSARRDLWEYAIRQTPVNEHVRERISGLLCSDETHELSVVDERIDL